MYFFGGINLFGLIVCWLCIPGALNESSSEDEQIENEIIVEEQMYQRQEAKSRSLGKAKKEKKKLNIGLCTVLTNKHSFFALLTCFVGTLDVTFYGSYISNQLVNLGLEET